MAADSLIDEHVSSAQCMKAFKALHAYALKKQAERDEGELLPSKDEHVWLVVGTKVMHPEMKLKPHRIPLKHPLVDPRSTSVCLITKDPQRQYKDLLDESGVKFISRVVGITKLKGKFRGFDARRALLNENGLFLADERVIPLLPKLLGSKFFQAKKQPIPVSLTTSTLKTHLEKAISSTYFHQNKGTCTSIKIGPLSSTFGTDKLLDNLKEALPAVVAAIKGGWDNVQNLHVKTSSSVALPIWTCALGTGEGERWDGLTVEEEKKTKKEKKEKGKDEVKGKKRAARDEEDSDDDAESSDSDVTVKPTPSKVAKPKSSPAKDDSKAKKSDDLPPKKKRKQDDDGASVPSSSKNDGKTKKRSTDADEVAPKKKPKQDEDVAVAPPPSKADGKTKTKTADVVAEDVAPKKKRKQDDDDAAPKKKRKQDEDTVVVAPSSSKKDKHKAPEAVAAPPSKAVKKKPTVVETDKPASAPAPAAATKDKPKSSSSKPTTDKPKSSSSKPEPSATKPSSNASKATKPASTAAAPLKSALKSSTSEKSSDKPKKAAFAADVGPTAAELKAKRAAAGGNSKKDKIVSSGTKDKERKKAALTGRDKRR